MASRNEARQRETAESRIFDSSRSDTTSVLLWKRHFTRASARISHASASFTRSKIVFHCAALPCLVPGCRFVPFKIAASGARALLAMTQNWNVIFGKGAFLQYSGTHSTISIRINVSFFQRNPPVLSLRGRSAAVAIFKPKVWHPAAKHGSANRQKSRRTSRILPLRARRRTPKSSGSE